MFPINRKIGLFAVLFTLLLAVSSWATFATPIVSMLELRMGSSSYYKNFSSYMNGRVYKYGTTSFVDLNSNAGTDKYGYLGMAFHTRLEYNYYPTMASTASDDERPITDIIIVDFGKSAAASDIYYHKDRLYHRLHVIDSDNNDYPLNRTKNNKEHHLYMFYTKDYIDGRMITDIKCYLYGKNDAVYWSIDNYYVVTDQNDNAANIATNGSKNFLYIKKEYLQTGEYGDYATSTIKDPSYYSGLSTQVMPYNIWGEYSVTSYGSALKNCTDTRLTTKVNNKYEDAYWNGTYFIDNSWHNGTTINVSIGTYEVYIKKECGYAYAAVVEGPYLVRVRKLTSADYNNGGWFYYNNSNGTVYSGQTAKGLTFSDHCLSSDDFYNQAQLPSYVTYSYSTSENGSYTTFNPSTKTWTSGTYYIKASRPSNTYCETIETKAVTLTVSKSKLIIQKDNGEADIVIEAEEGAKINYTLPTNLTKTGHTFNGWNKSVPSTMPAGVTYITAQWTKNTYGLYLYRNNPNSAPVYQTKTNSSSCPEGTNNTSCYSNEFTSAYKYSVYKYDSTISYPTWYKVGYKHTGWKQTAPAKMPANYLYLDAKWTPINYTMTFNTDGGSSVPSITQGYETSVTKPADPTRTGYTFKGWSPAIPSTMPYGNTSYTAQWDINTYYVTFYDGFSLGSMSSKPVTYGSSLSSITYPKTPTHEGYTFTGWDPATLPATMPANDIIVNAQWSLNYYKVKIPEQMEIVQRSNYDPTLDKYGYNSLIQLRLKKGYKIWGDLVYTGTNPETVLKMNTTTLANGIYAFHVAANDGEVKATDKVTEDYGSIQILPDHSEAIIGYDTTVTDKIETPIKVYSVSFAREFTKNFAEVVMLPFDIGIQDVRGGVFCKFLGMDKSGFNYTARLMFVSTALSANTPYLFVPTAKKMSFKLSGNNAISIKTSDSPENRQGDWVLRGNYDLINWENSDIEGAYVFVATATEKNGVNGSFKKATSGTLQPLSGYLVKETPAVSGVRGINGNVVPKTMSIEELPDEIGIRIETESGKTTALGTLNTVTGEVKIDRWFDAQGRLLKGKPTIEGIYYNNGKKVIIK